MSKLEIGVLVGLTDEPELEIKKVADLGLASCQICSWNQDVWTEEISERILAATEQYGVNVSTLWAGYPGPAVWNFIEGPKTIGLVPAEYRQMRVEALKKAADFAVMVGFASITTHVGFIPEDPNDPVFKGVVEALKQVAGYCGELGIEFWFETGQETPTCLLRTIERINTGNLGINLDTGNLIRYGKANPVDALDTFGSYVRDVHAKDGLYPTDGDNLGKEAPLGEGKVNFPIFVPKLKALGYTGPLTIEREISGEQQIIDIKKAIKILQPLC